MANPLNFRHILKTAERMGSWLLLDKNYAWSVV